MHSFTEATAGVPAFLAKLWRLVEDPDTNDLICWRTNGKSFLIQNQAQFARKLLPLNYKHNNMASFIRQLNMYGFHKITSIDNGGLKFDKDEMEFSHPYFQKDRPYLLEHIKRKIAHQKLSSDEKSTTMRPETINKVMNEVKSMRGRQDTLDSRFLAMKQENEALWREIAILRQKHLKQQQIVNKLIQFLVTIVQPTRGKNSINNINGIKRRFQLMINGVPEQEQSAKMRKLDSVDTSPVIHELTEDLFDGNNYEDIQQNSSNLLSPELDTDDNSLDDINEPISAEIVTCKIENPDEIDDDGGGDNGEIIAEVLDDENISFITNELDVNDMENGWINANELNNTSQSQSSASNPSKNGKNMIISSLQPNYKVVNRKNRSVNAGNINNNNNNSKRSTPTTIRHQSTKLRSNVKSILNKTNKHILKRKETSPPLRLNINGTPKPVSKTNGKILITIPGVSGNNKICIPVDETITTTTTTPPSTQADYTKTDFLSSEIPNELFQTSDNVNDILNENLNTTPGTNSTQSEDYIKKIKNPIVSTTAPTNSKNMALTKYMSNQKKIDSSVRGGDNCGNTSMGNKLKDNQTHINSTEDVNTQLDNMQNELDSLKDFFQNDDFSLESNTLMNNTAGPTTSKNRGFLLSPSVDNELFSKIFGDLDAPYELALNPEFGMDKRNDVVPSTSGSELISYQPYSTNIDLSEFLTQFSPNVTPTRNTEDENILNDELNTPCIEKDKIPFKGK